MAAEISDIKRDIAIVDTGGFFCYACLIGMPAIDQSPDPRYCQICYEFLLEEASMISKKKLPGWVPQAQKTPQKLATISRYPRTILSTVNESKITVDKKKRTTPKRGRPQISLPEVKIKEMHLAGMKAKAIANCLKVEGLSVSYQTIYRYLQNLGG